MDLKKRVFLPCLLALVGVLNMAPTSDPEPDEPPPPPPFACTDSSDCGANELCILVSGTGMCTPAKLDSDPESEDPEESPDF